MVARTDTPGPAPDDHERLNAALADVAAQLRVKTLKAYVDGSKKVVRGHLGIVRGMIALDQLGDTIRSAGIDIGPALFPDATTHLKTLARAYVGAGFVEPTDPLIADVELD